MKINQAGINLLKEFEALVLTAYRDLVGVWTIGYGHTGPEVVRGLTWTEEKAELQLLQDLSKFESGVSSLVKVNLNENQFSALVSFAYNVGLGGGKTIWAPKGLEGSHLLDFVNKGDFDAAADAFLQWNHAGGKVVAGLTRRREAERALFLEDV